MSCGTCGNKCGCMKLGPVSFGLALGITGGLSVLIGSVWMMYHGVSPMMAMLHLPVPTLTEASMHALRTLVKGFVFGFFVALFYDCISSCFKKCKCGKKTDEMGTSADKTEVAK